MYSKNFLNLKHILFIKILYIIYKYNTYANLNN